MALSPPRPTALITGAAGGMGRACARLFGATHDLILTDAAEAELAAFAAELSADGHTVVGAHAGGIGDAALVGRLVGHLSGPFVLIHTAGLSPAMADWRTIMAVNLAATEALLRAVERVLAPGSVAVLIASTAGHAVGAIPGAAELLHDPLAPDFLDRIGALIEGIAPGGAGGLSYALSKKAVIELVERRAIAWGSRGARIVSISPGLILTAMGRKELAETPGAAQLAAATPLGRTGAAVDIAHAARFLASEEAAFVTGCDLRVDGGAAAVMRSMARQ